MSTKTYAYRVTITFDLSYSKSPEYRLINAYLDEKGITSLKSLDENMPSNIYTGVVYAEIDVAGVNPTLNELKVGSDKVVRNTFEAIKRNAENSGIAITLYVQASPELATSSRKSRI